MRLLHHSTFVLLLFVSTAAGELKTKEDDKGVIFTTRNENLTAMAAKTEDGGKISQSYYFRGYWIWTIIGWTKEALEEGPEECLFQRRMVGGRTNKDEPLGLGFAFLRRGTGKEIFHVSHDGEIIDAYYVAVNNELTALSDQEFEAYIKEREASRE